MEGEREEEFMVLYGDQDIANEIKVSEVIQEEIVRRGCSLRSFSVQYKAIVRTTICKRHGSCGDRKRSGSVL